MIEIAADDVAALLEEAAWVIRDAPPSRRRR